VPASGPIFLLQSAAQCDMFMRTLHATGGGEKLQMRHFDASRSVAYRAGASTSNQEFPRCSDEAMKKALLKLF
jgi:hypothetical protein